MDRAMREREQHNQGLKRDTYDRALSHTRHFYNQRRHKIIRAELAYGHNKKTLELGSTEWFTHLDQNGIYPSMSCAINISEVELAKGQASVGQAHVRPELFLMDANRLGFADNSMDMIYGGAILHHLDHVPALDEIRRVLKKDGRIFFIEPLDVNPVGKIVRLLTPQARTVDERPWRLKELRELKERFDCKLYYEELFSVPLGVLSRLIFKNPDNGMMRFAYRLDLWIEKHLPFMRPFFRMIIVTGTPKVPDGR